MSTGNRFTAHKDKEVVALYERAKKKSQSTSGTSPFPLDHPPFSLKDIRQAIPKHCFEHSLLKSFAYLAFDFTIIAIFGFLATFIDHPYVPFWSKFFLWPLYWYAQGTIMTGVWVLAHECGHGGFSNYKIVNDVVGLLCHSSLLVPYHSWRISHRNHHSNTSSMENDEVFVPSTRSAVRESLSDAPLVNLFYLFMTLTVGWLPGYLVFNSSGPAKYANKTHDHFNPYSALFNVKSDFWDIVISDIFFGAAVAGLVWFTHVTSLLTMIKFYWIPFMIVNYHLVLITYLQHTAHYIPHYSGDEWTWLRGALCTVDRSFGKILDSAFHHITDTHVCHHLFSYMPFYHAQEATKAIKPMLKDYYLRDDTPIAKALFDSWFNCKFVEDEGKILFYKRKLDD